MGKLKLRVACAAYDRTRPLIDGTVTPSGIDLEWHALPIEETLRRMLRNEEFDLAEMSLSPAVIAKARGTPGFVSLPIFPSRFFRHSCLFVHADSVIERPQDLAGKRVGLRNYHRASAAVWFRGFLQDDYGVRPEQIQWYLEEGDKPGRADRIEVTHSPDISLTAIPPGATLDGMLAAGELDAALALRMPRAFAEGSSKVRRLFPNYWHVEREYFRRTRIFPIMHDLVVRRDVFEKNPWIGESLCEAFDAAKQVADAHSYDIDASHSSLAWFTHYFEEERELLGTSRWSYGLEPNRPQLTTFLTYCFRDGLTERLLTPDDLFEEVPWSPRLSG